MRARYVVPALGLALVLGYLIRPLSTLMTEEPERPRPTSETLATAPMLSDEKMTAPIPESALKETTTRPVSTSKPKRLGCSRAYRLPNGKCASHRKGKRKQKQRRKKH